MFKRTYGWVQNPSNLENLKKTVQIFDPLSKHYSDLMNELVPSLVPFSDLKQDLLKQLSERNGSFSYLQLVGTAKDINGKSAKKRSDAVADGLIQITVSPQSLKTKGKRWTDNWTADGFLRWALSLNFVKHDRETDFCSITDKGLKFSRSTANVTEDPYLIEALLAYPPASRVLSILNESSAPMNKFEIGEQLGFKGEKGFTSYPSELMEDWFKQATTSEQRSIRSDVEGTADKYARMIAGWLEKVGFVQKSQIMVSTNSGNKAGFQTFSITARGKLHYLRSTGCSKNKQIPKYVNWEFLAVDGTSAAEKSSRDYVRTRRAYVLQFAEKTQSFDVLKRQLRSKGFLDSDKVIRNDISGLNNIGIRIDINGGRILLKDKLVGLDIPPLEVTTQLRDSALNKEKIRIIESTDLPLKYYELFDIAYDSRRNRDFEFLTVDLLKHVYGFEGSWLGGSRKPDGAVYTTEPNTNYGIILDTKSYSSGYSKNISQEDEMVRYIEDNQLRDPQRNPNRWWEIFPETISPDNTYFLWISSKFTGQFRDQLVDTFKRTGTHGAALAVDQLLIGADLVKKSKLNLSEIPHTLSEERVVSWKE